MSRAFPPSLGQTLFRYLAMTARNQTSFPKAFAELSEDVPTFGKQARRLKHLADDARDGAPLSELLASPGMFAPATVALLAQAEANQRQAPVLDTLADDFRRRELGRAKLKAALAWPATLFCALLVIASVASVFVIPAFKDVFDSLGSSLPAPTQLLLHLSNAVATVWWLVVPAIVALALVFWSDRVPRSWAARGWRFLARVPGVHAYLARGFGSRLALWVDALGNDRPLLLAALLHLQQTSETPLASASASSLAARLQGGDGLASALVQTDLAPPSLVYASRMAEDDHDARSAMDLCQELTQEQAISAAARLERGLFAATYLVAGALVAFFVLAIYLPIFRLGAAV